MSAQPPLPPLPSSTGCLRVEYLDFKNLAEHREFRFRACGPAGWTEFRLRIATAAFGARQVRLQDSPDLCYQKLLRTLAVGEPATSDPITIDEADLAAYREAHSYVPKHASWTPTPAPTPTLAAQQRPRKASPRSPVAPPVAAETERALEEGQRVSHGVFGLGVTHSSGGGHTVVRFDQDGLKTFVTPMLVLDVLSAPHTWETRPRGVNRLRPMPSQAGATAANEEQSTRGGPALHPEPAPS